MKVINLKRNTKNLTFNDKSQIQQLMWYIPSMSFFLGGGLIFFKEQIFLSILFYSMAIIFILMVVNLLLFNDLNIDLIHNIVYYKSLIPCLINKVEIKKINHFYIKQINSESIGQDAWRVINKVIHIIIKDENENEIWIASFNIPNKYTYHNELINKEIKQLETILIEIGFPPPTTLPNE